VIRGPASAVWGANALTGVVNVITKSPREAPGTTVSISGGFFDRDAGSTAGKGVGKLFGANATVARAPNASGRTASRRATSTPIRCRGRPAASR
jgi:outer membrane cobalamin receptor